MTEMSRRPASDICSVRGIGVADSAMHVDPQLELAQQLLLLDAEALLLVDDQQPEVLGAHVAREQAVGADEDVDLALGEGLDGLALLARRAEARDVLDRERVVACSRSANVP